VSKKVYDYILKNHDIIEDDMNKKNKNEKNKNKTRKEPKPRKTNKPSIPNMSHASGSSSNYRLVNNTLTFSDAKTDKIVVSFTFN
jgi:hypothetical protein